MFGSAICVYSASKNKKNQTYKKVHAILTDIHKFDGKKVFLEGCLILEFEGDAIYSDVESCDSRNYETSLWVNLSKEFKNYESPKTRKLKVKIEGVVSLKNKGHMGLWKGSLNNVKIISAEEIASSQ